VLGAALSVIAAARVATSALTGAISGSTNILEKARKASDSYSERLRELVDAYDPATQSATDFRNAILDLNKDVEDEFVDGLSRAEKQVAGVTDVLDESQRKAAGSSSAIGRSIDFVTRQYLELTGQADALRDSLENLRKEQDAQRRVAEQAARNAQLEATQREIETLRAEAAGPIAQQRLAAERRIGEIRERIGALDERRDARQIEALRELIRLEEERSQKRIEAERERIRLAEEQAQREREAAAKLVDDLINAEPESVRIAREAREEERKERQRQLEATERTARAVESLEERFANFTPSIAGLRAAAEAQSRRP